MREATRYANVLVVTTVLYTLCTLSNKWCTQLGPCSILLRCCVVRSVTRVASSVDKAWEKTDRCPMHLAADQCPAGNFQAVLSPGKRSAPAHSREKSSWRRELQGLNVSKFSTYIHEATHGYQSRCWRKTTKVGSSCRRIIPHVDQRTKSLNKNTHTWVNTCDR